MGLTINGFQDESSGRSGYVRMVSLVKTIDSEIFGILELIMPVWAFCFNGIEIDKFGELRIFSDLGSW